MGDKQYLTYFNIFNIYNYIICIHIQNLVLKLVKKNLFDVSQKHVR